MSEEQGRLFSRPEGDLSAMESALAAYIEGLEDQGLLKSSHVFIAHLAMDLAHATAASAGDGKASSSGTAKQLLEVVDRLPNPDGPASLADLLKDDDDDDDDDY